MCGVAKRWLVSFVLVSLVARARASVNDGPWEEEHMCDGNRPDAQLCTVRSPMIYRPLGATGLRVSALSFGTWISLGLQVDDDAAQQIFEAAFRRGVNFFDTAETYANGEAERMLGRVIKRARWKRSDLVISTKIFWVRVGTTGTCCEAVSLLVVAARRSRCACFCLSPDLSATAAPTPGPSAGAE